MEDLSQKVTRVTSFAEGALGGNPAGIVVCDREFPPDAAMQKTAASVGYSETAFVLEKAAGEYEIRYFTPAVEVPLCGHATLAAAWVIGGTWMVFHAKGGVVLTTWRGSDGKVWMDFPELPVGERLDGEARTGVLAAMGLKDAVEVVRAEPSILIVMEDERKVFAYQSAVGDADIGRIDAQGVAVTARAPEGRDYDFVSRYFAPRAGIAEDPVTGSLHCSLAPYWSAKLGRDALVGYQASDRGGIVHVEVSPKKPGRVLVGGHVRRMGDA